MDWGQEYADEFAAEFAEWCSINDWIFTGDKSITPNLWFSDNDEYSVKTTAELLEIFKREKGIK